MSVPTMPETIARLAEERDHYREQMLDLQTKLHSVEAERDSLVSRLGSITQMVRAIGKTPMTDYFFECQECAVGSSQEWAELMALCDTAVENHIPNPTE